MRRQDPAAVLAAQDDMPAEFVTAASRAWWAAMLRVETELGMTTVRLELTVGPGKTREEVRVLATVWLRGLPPRPRGTPIEVVLHRGDVLEVRLLEVQPGP